VGDGDLAFDDLPTADGIPEGEHGIEHGTEHEEDLEEIGPDDGFDATKSGIDGGDGDEEGDGADVEPEGFGAVGVDIFDEFPGSDEEDGWDEHSGTAGEDSGEEKDRGGGEFGGVSEASFEEFVDGDDAEFVEGTDEEIGDDDASEDGSDGELGVGEIAEGVAFAWGTEESACADFGGEDGGEDGPPGDIAITDGEAFDGAFSAAFVEADTDDDDEVGEDDEAVEDPRIGHREVETRD